MMFVRAAEQGTKELSSRQTDDRWSGSSDRRMPGWARCGEGAPVSPSPIDLILT
jgi:hypothetical protein